MRLRCTLWLTALALLLPASSLYAQSTKSIGVLPARIQKEMAQGRRYALLIGIGRYQDKRIPKLDYTAADAKAMYAVLTDPNHGRFPKERVKLLLDERATAKNIRRHFTWLRRNARPEDMVVVFYSGHGAPEEGGTYWVPYDAEIDDLDSTAISDSYIMRQLSRIRSKRLIMFLDSCYSAAIVEKEDKPKALFDQDFFKKFQGTGRVTITASDGKELSLESKELGQGVFTHYLVQALKGKADTNQDGAVELEEVWAHVRRRVTDEARKRGNRQRPKLIGNLSAGFLVSLNPAVTEKFRVRQMKLVKLLQEGRLSGVEFEEAKKVLDGEGNARLLPIVRDLADGKLAPKYYRSARADALGKNGQAAVRPGVGDFPRPRPLQPTNIAALLKRADAQIGLNRLTSPKGDNAYDTLQKTLRITPGHPEAIKRLKAIGEKYKAWARGRIRAKQWKRAERLLLSAKKVLGEDPDVEDLLASVRERLGAETGTPPQPKPRPPAPPPVASVPKGKGDLYVNSDPPGAGIFVDGRDTGKKTPELLAGLPAGMHKLLVKKSDALGAFRSVEVKPNALLNLDFRLERLLGALYVKVRPFGSEVLVDGKKIGRTPLNRNLPTGRVEVEVRKEGHHPLKRTVRVRFGKTAVLTETLQAIPKGTLIVQSVPAGATILVDGKEMGKTPRGARALRARLQARAQEGLVQAPHADRPGEAGPSGKGLLQSYPRARFGNGR